VPKDIVKEATGPNGTKVSFEVSAEDDRDGPVDVSCDHNSGETFLIGKTVVKYTTKDAAGNAGEDQFTWTVNPGEAAKAKTPLATQKQYNL
jgi:hypothetical protein